MRQTAFILATGCLVLGLISPSGGSAQFAYRPPGELESPGGGALRPGAGREDSRVYAPGMTFPIEGEASYANSQIYGHGGYMGPGGGQCTAANYAYPWHDNYCEARRWTMPLCPSGTGHQGQDIRPATCDDEGYAGVAAVDGVITNVGSYSVYLTGDDGTRYDYLHMGSVRVRTGQRVSRGEELGRISNEFGGTSTTIHLHFNLRQNVDGLGSVYVPPYMSLVRAFETIAGPPPYRATFVRQSFPFARDAFELGPGELSFGRIEMRNEGSETWRPGEVFLGTTEPRDVPSPIAAESWVSPNRAATVLETTPPGEVGVFEFEVRAPDVVGDYPQFFNLVRSGIGWFSEPGQGGPADDLLQIPVTTVVETCEGTTAWACEGTNRVRCVDSVRAREACEEACSAGACVRGEDNDGDGFAPPADCDDGEPRTYPGAREICDDGIDQDCSGADSICPPMIDGGAGPPPRPSASGCGCAVVGSRTEQAPSFWILLALCLVAWRFRGTNRKSTASAPWG